MMQYGIFSMRGASASRGSVSGDSCYIFGKNRGNILTSTKGSTEKSRTKIALWFAGVESDRIRRAIVASCWLRSLTAEATNLSCSAASCN